GQPSHLAMDDPEFGAERFQRVFVRWTLGQASFDELHLQLKCAERRPELVRRDGYQGLELESGAAALGDRRAQNEKRRRRHGYERLEAEQAFVERRPHEGPPPERR